MRVLLVILILAAAIVLIVTMTVVLENIDRKSEDESEDSFDGNYPCHSEKESGNSENHLSESIQ
ncbi:hypothetical protein PFJ87_07g02070 [Encephalitozoon hellem]|uniref:Uncharacterized protein n=1 Tax=Encephalitozoon hellem TaxID=27973 RepID=A0ABY8CJR1_ENCHE|nr:hypothetical protein PFJ87_07g02070 [Encephalitozoon hellem]